MFTPTPFPVPEVQGHLEDERELESVLSDRLDDRTLAYVLNVRPGFDTLRQVAAQLAGLLVLAASGGRMAFLEMPVLDRAAGALAEAKDVIHLASVPPPALSHHSHLTRAARLLGGALATARSGSLRHDDGAIDAILKQLRDGWQELHQASHALPGFQVVDFSQGCCALHGPAE